MEAKIYPDKKNLYRLPWSINDNPIGWVEVTDVCNIHCEGCYRPSMGEGHKSLEKVKEEILFMKEWRNCDVISLAGGEALLHPNILEIIKFIKKNKMKSLILTNGLVLTEQFIIDLKDSGLTGLSFHIDTTQALPEFNEKRVESELELNDLRLKYAKMVKKAGLYAHFGITVTEQNYNEVPKFIQWVIDNMKLISGVSLIIHRGLPVGKGIDYYANDKKVEIKPGTLGYAIDAEKSEISGITTKELYTKIKEYFPDYDASSYLGGTVDHTSIKWLLGNIIVNSKGQTFGAYGKKAMELIQTLYHHRRGSYIIYSKHRSGKRIFLLSLFDKTLRKATFKFLKYILFNPVRFFYSLNTIGIGMVQPADILPDGSVDMCDDCPDLCVHNGKLVYSCRLDEYKLYGSLLRARIVNEEVRKDVMEKGVAEIVN